VGLLVLVEVGDKVPLAETVLDQLGVEDQVLLGDTVHEGVLVHVTDAVTLTVPDELNVAELVRLFVADMLTVLLPVMLFDVVVD